MIAFLFFLIIYTIMNKAYEKYSKNPYEIPKVVLASISDEIQLDENLEPPFIRQRFANNAYLFLDVATGSPLTTTPSNRICTSDTALSRVNRIYLSVLTFRWYTPNINPRNNQFSFFWSTTGITYNITLTENNLVGLLRMQALTAAMNVAVGAANFSAALTTNFPNTYTITAIVGNFYFLQTTNGVVKGRYLWGMSSLNTGPSTLNFFQTYTYFTDNYTRYMDISSYEITQFAKIDAGGNAVPNDVIIRYNVNTAQYGMYEFATINSPAGINFSRERNITSVDIKLTDEFGELLYIPSLCWLAFSLSLTFLCEL